MGEKEERDAYIRSVNDLIAHDKKFGEEIQFVAGNEIITIKKTEEFENAVDILDGTNKSVFITGKAGTGKSTLLKYFKSKSKKDVAVLAFTGLAAINVGGETIHSFFKFPLGFVEKKSINSNDKIAMVIRSVNTIVLDEVSMIRADLMDAINISLQKNRQNTLPFGGVQMIFIGDLHQLPPIVEQDLLPVYSRYYKTPFFFSADVFNTNKVVKVDLQKIHRQNDQLFVDILNDLREKKHTHAVVKMLNMNVVDNEFMKSLQASDYVVLCTTNSKTRQINDFYMSKLKTPIFQYNAKISGLYDPISYPTDEVLDLKEGCKVIFIRNDNQFKAYVNGDVGIVKRLTKSSILVESKGKMINVEMGKWDKFKYDTKYEEIRNEDGTVEKKKVLVKNLVGSFEQYPLKLAWAISIHKSQGQTYDKVLIDFDKGCFTSGQAYVALSRCRTLQGIKLRRPMLESDVILDRRIYEVDKIVEYETKNIDSIG